MTNLLGHPIGLPKALDAIALKLEWAVRSLGNHMLELTIKKNKSGSWTWEVNGDGDGDGVVMNSVVVVFMVMN